MAEVTVRTPAERAYEVLDFIEAHPDKHDQSAWIRPFDNNPFAEYTAAAVANECGTTACFAGWTALLAGRTMAGAGVVETGEHVLNEARALLELDFDEADRLFYQAGDLAEVRKAVSDIFGPRP